jgi:hypothetical protein
VELDQVEGVEFESALGRFRDRSRRAARRSWLLAQWPDMSESLASLYVISDMRKRCQKERRVMALLRDRLPPPLPGRDPNSLSQSLMEHAAKVETLERIAAGFKAGANALVARIARKRPRTRPQ